MKSILATLKNSKGIVMLVAIMILLAVFAIGLSMVVSAGMSSTIAKNYKNKLLSFYASDGQMTVLAQVAVDSTYWNWVSGGGGGGGSAPPTVFYLGQTTTGLPSSPATMKGNLAAPPPAPNNGWSPTVTLSSSANVYHWYSNALTGTYAAGNWTDTTITGAATGSYTIALYATNNDGTNPVQIGGTVTVSNHTGGGNNINVATITSSSPTVLSNQRLRFTVSWVSGSVTMAYATSGFNDQHGPTLGTPASSGTSLVDTGAGTASFSKYKVAWYLKVLEANKVNLQTRAYDSLTKWGVVFETPLKQYIERQGGVYVNPYGDTALVPVTFYDFRSNRTNPEFEQPNDGWRSKRMVQDTLDTERKPILGSNMHLNRYIQKWFRPWLPGDSTIPIYQNTTLSYNTKNHSYLSRWKIPHLGTDGYQGCTPFTGKVDSSWGFCYCGGSCGNNCSTWGEYCSNCSTGVFIDTCLNRWDSAFYNVVIKDTLKFHLKDQATGTYEFATDSFFRLDNKGLGKEWNWWKGLDHNGCSPAPCYDDHNYSFTMEIKRTFTKVPNLKFNFTGDDDVWLFLNNRLAMDIGGCHQKVSDSAIVDNITPALTNGTVYNFDFFYCERHSANSDIKITTNMLVYKPVTTKQRHWKREYGRLD
jgi:fibro-slime domain-containing protein